MENKLRVFDIKLIDEQKSNADKNADLIPEGSVERAYWIGYTKALEDLLEHFTTSDETVEILGKVYDAGFMAPSGWSFEDKERRKKSKLDYLNSLTSSSQKH